MEITGLELQITVSNNEDEFGPPLYTEILYQFRRDGEYCNALTRLPYVLPATSHQITIEKANFLRRQARDINA